MLIRRLDQALGREEEAIAPRRPVAPFIAERRFAEPISPRGGCRRNAHLACRNARPKPRDAGLGARALELALFRVDGFVARTAIGTSRPIRAPKLVLELFREKFAGLGETFDAGFGFDTIRLAVQATAPLPAAQIDLAGDALPMPGSAS
jgi:protein ImuB